MDILLTDEEIRVLGCLMEKEMATPDNYPLSLNALINACNQKSNRNPVVSYDEETVDYALKGLRQKKLAMESSVSRVAKYAQTFSKDLKLTSGEEAIICIVMVRGPQTQGEIRGRTERLHAFTSLDEVQEVIVSLEHMGLLIRLPREPGRKESRYMHLLSKDTSDTVGEEISLPETSIPDSQNEGLHLEELQKEIDTLRLEIKNLRLEFDTFKTYLE